MQKSILESGDIIVRELEDMCQEMVNIKRYKMTNEKNKNTREFVCLKCNTTIHTEGKLSNTKSVSCKKCKTAANVVDKKHPLYKMSQKLNEK